MWNIIERLVAWLDSLWKKWLEDYDEGYLECIHKGDW